MEKAEKKAKKLLPALIGALMLVIYILRINGANVLFNVALCVPVITLIWWDHKRSMVVTMIIATLSVLCGAAAYGFLPGSAAVWTDTAAIGLAVVGIWRLFTNKKARAGADVLVLLGNSLGLFFVFIIRAFRFSFLGDTAFPFWPIALTFGVCASVFVCIKWLCKKTRFWSRVGYFVLVVFLALESRPGLEMDWLPILDIVISGVFAFFTVRAIRAVYSQVEYRFMLL